MSPVRPQEEVRGPSVSCVTGLLSQTTGLHSERAPRAFQGVVRALGVPRTRDTVPARVAGVLHPVGSLRRQCRHGEVYVHRMRVSGYT